MYSLMRTCTCPMGNVTFSSRQVLSLCWLWLGIITGSEISKVFTISWQRTRDTWARGLRHLRSETSQGQRAELYLPVVITQSYDSLVPDLGVLINALIFFANINRFCLKDKRFQRLSNQKQAKQQR